MAVAIRAATAARRFANSLEMHGVRAGEVRVPLPHGRELALWSDGRDAMASLLWWRGWESFDPSSARTWMWLAERARVVLDVGANIGIFSLLAGLANPDAKVFAFEPIPATRRALEANLERNPAARVTCVPIAAAAKAGTLELYTDPDEFNDPLATTRPVHPARIGPTERLSVPAMSLDDWAHTEGIGQVGLVKIDVEYYEPEVLEGMEGILERDRPDLVIEVLDGRSANAATGPASELGYRPHLLTPAGPLPTTSVAPHPSFGNYLLTMRDDAELRTLWR